VRRCFVEVIITCYQMTVLVEAGRFGNASAHVLEDSAEGFPAASENDNLVLNYEFCDARKLLF
jgi:hypothetical protein